LTFCPESRPIKPFHVIKDKAQLDLKKKYCVHFQTDKNLYGLLAELAGFFQRSQVKKTLPSSKVFSESQFLLTSFVCFGLGEDGTSYFEALLSRADSEG
jgi:hypothetical protein